MATVTIEGTDYDQAIIGSDALADIQAQSLSAFRWAYLMFSAFILSCGVTHLISIVNIWIPAYYLDGFAKAVTAVTSVATAVLLWPLIPKAIAQTRPGQLLFIHRRLERGDPAIRQKKRRAGIVPIHIRKKTNLSP